MKLKKIGYATVYRTRMHGRHGIIYRSKKSADFKADLLLYSIKIVVPVYVKDTELKAANKVAMDKRKARAKRLTDIINAQNKVGSDAKRET